MLVDLNVMEQRYQAVLAVVQDGSKVVEVAEHLGVSRQTLHAWIARYEQGGLASLADRSHRPASCPHQIAPEIEAMICELRRQHPGWGPRRIEHQLARVGIDPAPSRSAVYRCLKRHGYALASPGCALPLFALVDTAVAAGVEGAPSWRSRCTGWGWRRRSECSRWSPVS